MRSPRRRRPPPAARRRRARPPRHPPLATRHPTTTQVKLQMAPQTVRETRETYVGLNVANQGESGPGGAFGPRGWAQQSRQRERAEAP